ncbi:hypothetical protein [Mycobacterium stomatepiae]|uniref:hypothetical protein n=1 Tax=Mycobacterium stomatepiae TaxID=470076 RepID=UPI0013D7311A|nr:hypothetical protein [Mycobacterium stomatepiae]MCV7164927.1 hypothetical protein [Mycobacterium stomatepiae]
MPLIVYSADAALAVPTAKPARTTDTAKGRVLVMIWFSIAAQSQRMDEDLGTRVVGCGYPPKSICCGDVAAEPSQQPFSHSRSYPQHATLPKSLSDHPPTITRMFE